MLRWMRSKDRNQFFYFPVDVNEVPTYRDIIKNPMSFDLMEARASKRAYKTVDDIQKDFKLIWLRKAPCSGEASAGSSRGATLSDQAEGTKKRPFPESKNAGVIGRKRAVPGRKTTSRDVPPPQRGRESGHRSNAKYYEGQFHVEGKDGVETVVVVVAIKDPHVQLSLQADSRGAHVNLKPLPLVPVSSHCWRLEMESLHENREVIENTIDAIKDLTGVDNLGFNDFRLCYTTQKLSLHLGTAPPLVVALDERRRE
ncbi:Bromodomain containing protein 7 [Perkinsus olseni]|uniref:Bromodomain containing protein 7 n=1 Tax=Perkinsus olseni TaxID=32597 RepID=A0A7J6NZH7_PEROL|nr:Bromodomain containing protein 7 [Perkinsus olseni]